MGHRFAANGNKEEQYTGLLGENMFKTIIGLYPTFEDGFDGGYDIGLNGKKVDVKTMGRSVDPKPHYVNNFISYQEHFDWVAENDAGPRKGHPYQEKSTQFRGPMGGVV